MRLDIVNNSSHADAPVAEMYSLLGMWIYRFTHHVPGSLAVLHDLQAQQCYVDLRDDLPDAPGAIAYHTTDDNGKPVMLIGTSICLDNGSDWLTGSISVISAVEHEVGETLANPLIDRWVDQPDGNETAAERCDGCQDVQFHYRGADHSDFLLDAWFNPWGKRPFTYCDAVNAPFTLTSGGYKIVRAVGGERQVFGEYGPDYPEWRKATNGRARLLGVQ